MQRTNTVVNVSSHPLTPVQTKLFIKNLSFCPTPHAINYIELSEDVYRFCRRLRLAEFFCDREDTETDNDADPPHATLPDFLRKPSPFTPDSGRDIALDTYIKAVTTDIMTLRQKDFSPNLTSDEKTALKDLKTNTNIIIKPADKEGAVVVMNTADYTTECTKQLSNTLYYKKLESDPTATYNNTIKRVLQEGMDKQELDMKTGHSLLQPHPTPDRFYILPKIHKEGHPGRPIISGNGCPTEIISQFVDHHMKILVKSIPSYVQDDMDFLRKVHDINNSGPLPPDTLLCTMDVSGLNTNIPHEEGIAACRTALEAGRERGTKPSSSFLCRIIHLILSLNFFTFYDTTYLQNKEKFPIGYCVETHTFVTGCVSEGVVKRQKEKDPKQNWSQNENLLNTSKNSKVFRG
ncbi:hypothetical protein ElyMa_002184400 [Elysia marginata]|uniref:Uncharacterized protein n=1 Tax=Elysia marginata TaxID=1093978 RepID=A0AAV4FSI5_9GAST|nr:hypothetical protein ElyMa_002184400 [Elysia marginata]